MFEPLVNPEGKSVYPANAGAFVDDPQAVFSDEVYNQLKSPSPAPADPAPAAPAPAPAADPAPAPADPAPTPPGGNEPPANPTPAVDFDAILKEKTGGKVEKWDDLMAKLNQPQTPAEIQFANDKSKKIFEYLKEGKQDEVFDLLQKEKLLAGVDKMSESDRVKLKMQIENPDWNIDDVEDEFNARFGLSDDEAALTPAQLEKEKRGIERRLKAEAKEAAKYFEQMKGSLELPELPKTDATAAVDPKVAQYESQLSELEKINTNFQTAVQQQASQLGVIDLSVNDKDVQFTHQFEIPEADRTRLAERAKEYWSEFNARYSKDGQWDAKKLMEDLYIRDNLTSIIKSAISKASSEKHIGVVRGMANAVDPNTPAPAYDIQAEAARKAKEDYIMR